MWLSTECLDKSWGCSCVCQWHKCENADSSPKNRGWTTDCRWVFFFYSFGSSCENKENQILVFFIFLHNILECLLQWWGKVSFLFLKGWTEVELLDVCSWLRLKFWCCASALPAVLLLPPSLPVDLCAGCLVWRRRILWRLSLCIRAMWDYGTQSHCA